MIEAQGLFLWNLLFQAVDCFRKHQSAAQQFDSYAQILENPSKDKDIS